MIPAAPRAAPGRCRVLSSALSIRSPWETCDGVAESRRGLNMLFREGWFAKNDPALSRMTRASRTLVPVHNGMSIRKANSFDLISAASRKPELVRSFGKAHMLCRPCVMGVLPPELPRLRSTRLPDYPLQAILR
jgi:hypothetical protein